MAKKLTEIDKMKEITNLFVDKILNDLRTLFKINIPDLEFESLIN